MADRNEERRVSALKQLGLLDTNPSESFDRITRMASQIFGLPIAAVSLTDSDRQWFKSRLGVRHTFIPREAAPCSEVSASRDIVVISDMLASSCYRESHLAKSGIRFYAGAPLVTREGYGLGAMCVLGTEPRSVTSEEIAALTDLAAMVMSQIELQHAFGRIDPQSGLPNRNQFEEDLDDLEREGPPGERYLAVFLELATPEELSRAARVVGATFLEGLCREAAYTLRGVLGPTRKAYHVGVNQFAFLSPPNVEEADYIDLVGSRLREIRERAASRFVSTTAIGIAPFLLGGMEPSDVLRTAESAAQDGRKSGRHVSVYSPSEDAAHTRRFTLLNDFGSALEQAGQLRLVFQPRIEISSGRCVGAEALLRWAHPTMGEVSPAEFIPIVEQTSMARAMMAWVLEGSLRQLSRWLADGIDLQVSVNMSAANLRETDFVDRLAQALAAHSLPASSLELELTESAVMDDAGVAVILLEQIAATGVRLAIDDFGTGYSSLSYLQQLPTRTLKIDRSFINGCETDPGKMSLISAMITLAHDLEYRVVAEGVETQSAFSRVSALGCDEVQGYFFGRPMAPADFMPWFLSFNRSSKVAA